MKTPKNSCSHLFQRVASFLHEDQVVLILRFLSRVLISFREWLHSYIRFRKLLGGEVDACSHLFQRVASFLLFILVKFLSKISR